MIHALYCQEVVAIVSLAPPIEFYAKCYSFWNIDNILLANVTSRIRMLCLKYSFVGEIDPFRVVIEGYIQERDRLAIYIWNSQDLLDHF